MNAATNRADQSRSSHTIFASVAALVSVIAASSCCLPIVPFVFAASLAGSSTVLTALRPYLLGTSVLSIAYGFYQAWQSKRCSRKSNFLSSALLWLSAFFVFVSIFFPQVLANAAANLLASEPDPQSYSLHSRCAASGRRAFYIFLRQDIQPLRSACFGRPSRRKPFLPSSAFNAAKGKVRLAHTAVPNLNGLFAGGLCNRRSVEELLRQEGACLRGMGTSTADRLGRTVHGSAQTHFGWTRRTVLGQRSAGFTIHG